MKLSEWIQKDATIAKLGFNRWLVPPAAIAVHMCIGQVYAFSVFKTPLTKTLGIVSPAEMDWSIAEIGVAYSLSLALLGLSAASFGKWAERNGPRLTMLVATLFFCSGYLIAALAVKMHILWLLYIGYGLISGVGLGLGYIAPVSTLMKWFPDKPGMATGLAIMGFGGGSLIGAPLARELMDRFSVASTGMGVVSNGVSMTFLTLALLCLVMMLFAAIIIRVPAENWKPEGWVEPVVAKKMVATYDVSVDVAWRTPQFLLLWIVLCMNVSAGIGILGQAEPMIVDMFQVTPAAGAGFVGLLALCNLSGRFCWSTLSDWLGRKWVYMIYFIFGIGICLMVPYAQKTKDIFLFVVLIGLMISMYGGGFATLPVYLKDLFGTYQVGAIHGRMLAAWSVAALTGPTLVDRLSDYYRQHGLPKTECYNRIFDIFIILFLVGMIANFFINSVHEKYHYREDSNK
jgi:MFS family permease